MNLRPRKMAGVLATTAFLLCYSLLVMALGGRFVAGLGWPVELLFFSVAGIAWMPAVMMIIRWMAKDRPALRQQKHD